MDTSALVWAIALVVVAYLSGSLPIGVIVARIAGGPDPRTVGSGRTGGTNALRALGRRWAAVVVAGDVAKGALPVLLARVVTGDSVVEIACGLAAVVGSARSIFLGFTGGRGVGTGVGTLLVIQPLAVLLAAPVFFGVILLTRYVSLGSLIASAAVVPAMLVSWLVLRGDLPPPYLVYAALGAALIWLNHADNIERLRRGTERKLDFELLAGRRPGRS